MSRQKLIDRHIRKVSRNGKNGSFYVTIPIELIHELKWRAKQKVTVKRQGSKLIIGDWE